MSKGFGHFFSKILVLEVPNSGVFEQIDDFEGWIPPAAKNC